MRGVVSGWECSADYILKTVVGVIEGKEPVGNISLDANGKVAVSVTRGLPK